MKLMHLLLDEGEDDYTYSPTCSLGLLEKLAPDWVFFFHWSEMIEEEIYKNYKCICVHTGKLPGHRGGSPIQNQILENVILTDVNLISVDKEVDSGKIYLKEQISLQGTLSDIWSSITRVASKLIQRCVKENPIPHVQVGTIHTFKRRSKQPLDFNNSQNLSSLYDQIRMMDDDNYPTSYIMVGDYKLEFTRAHLNKNNLLTDVTITKQ